MSLKGSKATNKRICTSCCPTTGRNLGQSLTNNTSRLIIQAYPDGFVGRIQLFRGAKFLYHIQDLQIEAARDLCLIKSERVISGLFRMEKFILKNADYISTISEGMAAKVRKKADKKIYLLANWVDTKLFKPLIHKNILKEEFGFKPDDKVVLYSGAMGEKQGLEMILHLAKALQHLPQLKFLICGSGPYSKNLISMTHQFGLTNVEFLPLQPVGRFNRILNMADLHLVLQKSQATDLVMPSRLTTILAVGGLVLVTANEKSELYKMVTAHKIGIAIAPDNLYELISGVQRGIEGDWSEVTNNARKYAEEFLSIDGILHSYEMQVLIEDLKNS